MRALGCLTLMILSAGLCIGVLFAWENQSLLATIEPVFCQPSEVLDLRLFSSITRPIDFFCFMDDGNIVRHLNLLSYGLLAAIVLLPVVGVALALADGDDFDIDIDVEDLFEDGVKKLRKGEISSIIISHGKHSGDKRSLEDKLAELDRVYDAGMIEKKEYERTRRKVLDEFADDD